MSHLSVLPENSIGRRNFGFAVGGLVWAMSLVGCRGKVALTKNSPEVQACQADSDCAAGWQCRDHMCVGQGCQPDCEPGERSCQGNIVIACFYDAGDCPRFYPQWSCSDGEVCKDGICVPPGCDAICQLGEKTCDGDRVMVCTADETDCPGLAFEKECPADAHCQDGVCVSNDECSDECVFGQAICADGVPQACRLSEDGCLQFKPQDPCLEHQVCEGGACNCGETCQAGQTRCGPGGGVEQCLGPDAGGCTYWGQEQACGVHQVCSGGACQCTDGCNPSTTQCGPNGGQQNCETDGDGCNYLGPEQDCYADMSCVASEGECMPHTDPSCFDVNECLYYGQKKCMDPNYYGVCKYGDDGCLHWDCST